MLLLVAAIVLIVIGLSVAVILSRRNASPFSQSVVNGVVETPFVFGVGMNKTGTSSLNAALNKIGVPSYHTAEQGAELISRAALQREPLLTHFDPKLRGFSDFPFPRYFRELDQQYPGAKFILTTRDDSDWLKSRLGHDATRIGLNMPFDYRGEPYQTDAAVLLAEKRAQENAVRRYFQDRPEDLLIIDLTKGEGTYEGLAKFIGVETQQVGTVKHVPCATRKRANRGRTKK